MKVKHDFLKFGAFIIKDGSQGDSGRIYGWAIDLYGNNTLNFIT